MDSSLILQGHNPLSLTIIVENSTKDTLLNIATFYYQGNEKKYLVFPVNFEYTPNIIMFISNDIKQFEIDGYVNVQLNKIPKLIVIPSHSKVKVEVVIPRLDSTFVLNKNWDLLCWMSFSYKSEVDSLVYNYCNYYDEYKKSLISNKFYIQKAISDDLVILNEKNSSFYEKFLELFKIKKFSKLLNQKLKIH